MSKRKAHPTGLFQALQGDHKIRRVAQKKATNVLKAIPFLGTAVVAMEEVAAAKETFEAGVALSRIVKNLVKPSKGDLLVARRRLKNAKRRRSLKHKNANPVAVLMQVDPQAKVKRKMVRFARRRRSRRKSLHRRARRGRRKSMRGRRRSRKSRVPRPRLRLFPGGFPKTHVVKLRSMKQMTIHSNPGNWGYVQFQPSSMLKPLQFSASGTIDIPTLITSPAVLNHRRLIFTAKNGTTAVPLLAQPYGYDAWLETQSGTISDPNHQYDKYVVLGCKITIAFIPSLSTEGGAQVYAGFTKIQDQSSNYGTTFTQKYAEIDRTEISDMLNVGIVPDMGLVQAGGSGLGGVSKVYTFNYSQKKYKKHLKRIGVELEQDWYGQHGNAPANMPQALFVMADLGKTDGDATIFQCMVIHDYTIRLSGSRPGAQSVAS